MIVVLSLFIGALLSVLLIANYLERAPEAFEDSKGFHVLAAQDSAPPSGAVIAMTSARKVPG